MRLIDGDQTDANGLAVPHESGRGQPFGRDIQQTDRPVANPLLDVGVILPPGGPQRGDDQNQGRMAALAGRTGGNLVTDGFAGARRHDGQHIATIEDGSDDLQLPTTEGIVSVEALERTQRPRGVIGGGLRRDIWHDVHGTPITLRRERPKSL